MVLKAEHKWDNGERHIYSVKFLYGENTSYAEVYRVIAEPDEQDDLIREKFKYKYQGVQYCAVGVAKRNPIDKINKAKGRTLAFQRAIVDLPEVVVDQLKNIYYSTHRVSDFIKLGQNKR